MKNKCMIIFEYFSAIKNLEQTQGTWRQTPIAARHEAQLERLKAELKVKKKKKKRKKRSMSLII